MTTTLAHPQAARALSRPASEVHGALQTAGPALAAEATAQAVTELAPLLREGRFLRPPVPHVETTVPDRGPAAIRVTWPQDPPDRWPPRTTFATRPTSSWWRTSEEETGWPVATFDVVVEPSASGCRVTLLSSRPPGVDLSTNRVDKQLRDRVARAAVDRFLEALVVTLLGSRRATPAIPGATPATDG